MTLTLKTPASIQPVTLAEAKLHLRVDITDDDALITALIVAATADAEQLMGRAVLQQTWQLTLDSFFPNPDAYTQWPPVVVGGIYSSSSIITLQMPPVTAITSVQYLQAVDGVLTTMPNTDYVLANGNDYSARLVPAYGKTWPSVRNLPDAVRVLFVTGYTDAASVPELIKAWIKLRLGSLYENRSGWTVGTRAALDPNPFIDRLLDRYTAITC